ncbi:MAG: right-handed parallel beta-helix repeat-containing protein, partial [Gemmatimonadota bacterium]
ARLRGAPPWRQAIAICIAAAPRRYRLATGAVLAWLAMAPAVAGPLPAPRPVLVVTGQPQPGGESLQFRTLAQAVEAAVGLDQPLILLDPGEYQLEGPVTTALEIRARTLAEAGPPEPIDWNDCGERSYPLRLEPDVFLGSRDGRPALQVQVGPGERVSLSGVALRAPGSVPAAVVAAGELEVREAQVQGRLIARGEGASLTLVDVVVAPAPQVDLPPWPGRADDAAGAYGLPIGAGDCELAAVSVTGGARLAGSNLEIHDHTGLGLCVDGGAASLCGGSIHHIWTADGRYGRGAVACGGGSLILRGVQVHDTGEAGVVVSGRGSRATLAADTQVLRTGRSAETQIAVGLLVQNDAAASVEGGVLGSNEGPGLYVSHGAAATVTGATLSQNAGAGAVVYGATASFSRCTIEQTGTDASVGAGCGLYVDHVVFGAATVQVSKCTIADNQLAGIWVEGDGGSVAVTGTTLANCAVEASRGLHGNGVMARDVCTGLVLTGNQYSGNQGAQVLLEAANAVLSGSTYVSNGVLDFLQQGCTDPCVRPLTEADLAADGLSPDTHILGLCPAYDQLTQSTPAFTFRLAEAEVAR